MPSQYCAKKIVHRQGLTKGRLIGPAMLLVVRLLPIVLSIVSIVEEQQVFGLEIKFLYKFTNWTFVFSVVSEVLGCCICIKVLRGCGNQQEWSSLERAFQISFICSLTAGLMLTPFYWMIIYQPEDDCFSNMAKHGGIQVLLLLDLLLSRIPVVWQQYPAVAVYASIYMAFMWTINVVTGEPVYTPLDLNDSNSIRYYVVLPILLTGAYLVVDVLVAIRELVGNFERTKTWEKDDKGVDQEQVLLRSPRLQARARSPQSGHLLVSVGK